MAPCFSLGSSLPHPRLQEWREGRRTLHLVRVTSEDPGREESCQGHLEADSSPGSWACPPTLVTDGQQNARPPPTHTHTSPFLRPGTEVVRTGADLCQSLPDRCKILTKSHIRADLYYLWVSLIVLTGETEAARVVARTSIFFIRFIRGLSKVKVGLRRNDSNLEFSS